MSLEQQVANLVEASNTLTSTVNKKISQIDSSVSKAKSDIDSFIAKARDEYNYVNMYKNSFAKQKDDNGEYIFPISTWGAAVTAEVVKYADLPEHVKATVPSKFNRHESMTPNALHIVFGTEKDPTYWLPSNPVAGRFSGGFGHVYVVSGSMGSYSAGEYGNQIETKDRNSASWHLDFIYKATKGTEVYLFAPFVVAGYCEDASLVQFIPTQSAVLNCNIS